MEAWEALLPVAALQYIMESLVLPRLRLAVQSWDPLHDTVSLHTWVHPWLVSSADFSLVTVCACLEEGCNSARLRGSHPQGRVPVA